MRGRLAFAACCGLAAPALAVGQTRHHTEQVRLVWRVAPSLRRCPEVDWLRREVAGLVGQDPFADASPHTITVTIEPAGSRIVARVSLTEPGQAPRNAGAALEENPGQCNALVRAVATRIVGAIDSLEAVSYTHLTLPTNREV